MNSDKEKDISWPLLICAVAMSLVFAVGSSMTSVRKLFENTTEERKILSKIFTQIDSKFYVVFKLKTNDGITVEVYEKAAADGEQKLKQKFPLPGDTEAYIMLNNDSLNLGLVDVNKDGKLDIICPTVDKSGNSRLNVFQYSYDLSQFVPVLENN